MQGCFAALSMTGTVTVKPSTRSAQSIAVTSVLKLWRHGGRREPPNWLRPRAALGLIRRQAIKQLERLLLPNVLKPRVAKQAGRPNRFEDVARLEGFEPPTYRFEVC